MTNNRHALTSVPVDAHQRAQGAGAKVETLDDLFRREYEPMIRIAYVLTGNNEDAQDIVQEAFIEVQRRWKNILNPGGYLRTAVVNNARARSKKRTNRARILKSQAVVAEAETPDDYTYILDVLDHLPERQRTAIVLVYLGGMSAPEAAEAMSANEGTVRSWVHRGLKLMRKELEDE